ncbi:hypothetical protein JCM12296A_55920 [Desulfosarcina cetonica]|uniref:TrbC/VirB2 family protein n=1 Tax=Desulfosarcina cetonica TaxID=90730 RepID=UPI0006D11BC0|nr:TrbC/VirB2 family protein [Desulfosarcina cetonica]
MKKEVVLFCLLALFAVSMTPAIAGYNIESYGSTDAGIFTKIVSGIQDVVDLMDGPIAIGAIIIGLFVAGLLWAFAPDNRHIGKFMKVIAVGFVLLDVSVIINYLKS